MRQYKSFFLIQLKAALLLLPGLCLVLGFCILFGAGILLAGQELLKAPDHIKIPVALVLPEDDTYAELAFSFVERMESVRSTCSFTRTDEEHALSLLKSGRAYAAIMIPDRFVEDILNGTNSPATLLLSRQDSLESMLFVTLADAGVSTLQTAQAGIYALDTALLSCQKQASITEAEEALNKLYLSYALNRNKLFERELLSATGQLSVQDYYISSALVLFLLLSGIASHSFFHAEAGSMPLLLHRQGLSRTAVFLLKLLAVSVVYTVFLFPLAVLAGLLSLASLGQFFLLVLGTQTSLMLLSLLCPRAGTYYIVTTTLSVLCLFLSGAFLPSIFLPEAVSKIGNLLPTAWLLRLCRGML